MKKAVIAAACIAGAAVITLCGCTNKVEESNDYFMLTDSQYQALLDYYAENDNSDSAAMEKASAESLFSSVSILSIQTTRSSTGRAYTDSLTYGSGVIVDLDKEAGDAYVLTCCHTVYDSSAISALSTQVYLYLYGQDNPDVNYTVDYEETTYTSTNGPFNSSSPYYQYTVSGDDDYRMEATVVAASIRYDLALLKVTDSEVLRNSNAVAAKFDDADEVTIGESVYAIGNNLGDGSSVTVGCVSKDSCTMTNSLYGNVTNTYRVIQTSAPINTGSGGGGLYNTEGKLIGILTGKRYTSSSDTLVENTSFVLPLSQVKRACQLLMDSAVEGGATSPGLTVGLLKGYSFETGYSLNNQYNSGYVYDIKDPGYETTYTSAYLEYLDDAHETYRIGIKETVSATNSSYGLQAGDVITHLLMKDGDGNTIEDLDITRSFLLDDALISYRSGYTVTLTYERDGEEGTADVSCSTVKLA